MTASWNLPFKPLKKALKLSPVLLPLLTPLPASANGVYDNRELTPSQSYASTATTALGFGSAAFLVKRSCDRENREERKRVVGEVENFKRLKAEFFNVTAEVESDDDFMEGLRAARENVTLGKDDGEEE
eukprot:CAMPEP_0182463078 /NCGR_PEP_ID=MMETSP1319-20130603/7124_1 /TAXON_ID=172717 /ORGANISM="Bolidomonas pacifica, Strain RCC208" /LENGTH=128 /DNA_ID=CAMNT_0024662581 /DNA_START=273 /DNA_END=656 /DNA_ORIENTATION=+